MRHQGDGLALAGGDQHVHLAARVGARTPHPPGGAARRSPCPSPIPRAPLWSPRWRQRATWEATSPMRSGSDTEVPPNFWTSSATTPRVQGIPSVPKRDGPPGSSRPFASRSEDRGIGTVARHGNQRGEASPSASQRAKAAGKEARTRPGASASDPRGHRRRGRRRHRLCGNSSAGRRRLEPRRRRPDRPTLTHRDTQRHRTGDGVPATRYVARVPDRRTDPRNGCSTFDGPPPDVHRSHKTYSANSTRPKAVSPLTLDADNRTRDGQQLRGAGPLPLLRRRPVPPGRSGLRHPGR